MTSSRAASSLLATAVLVAALAPAPAAANGRFPAAQHVLVGPGARSTTIVLRTTFGFAVSDDAGATFHWICEDALQYAGPPFDPGFALDATGRIHAGVFNGLVRAGTDRCTYDRMPAVETEFVTDLDNNPDGTTLVAVSSSGGGARNRVYRSDDGGNTYRALGDGLPGVLFETLEMAPSDLSRVYLTGVTEDPRRITFYRSDDGGATIREMPLPALDGVSGAFIAAVDPTNRDVVFVRVSLVERAGGDAGTDASDDGGAGAAAGTALLRSTDGGATFREVARTHGEMLGFAISDDGRTVWMGGPDPADRLQRSDDGGLTFRRVNDVQVLCLRQHSGTLYVCANYVFDSFALGRSSNGGSTIEPILNLGDIQGAFPCPAGTTEGDICRSRWPVVQMNLPAPTPHDAGMDASTGDAHGAHEMGQAGNCGCRAAGSARSGRSEWGAWVAGLLVAMGIGRAKRRGSPPSRGCRERGG